MASVKDVAAFIIESIGPMTAMKLQKLVFYSQTWSLVWDGRPLFPEPVEAWSNGPVVRELFEAHRGQRGVGGIFRGDASRLTQAERATVQAVVDFYGNRDAEWLAELSHREAPWRDARGGIAPGDPSNAVITLDAMAAQYRELGIGPSKVLPASLARGLDLLVSMAPDEVDGMFSVDESMDVEGELRLLETGG